MKSIELIAKLKELDPEGKDDVLINNETICVVLKDPSFMDGCKEIVRFNDDTLEPDYLEISSEGYKINLSPIGVEDALVLNPDMEVKLNISNNSILTYYLTKVEDWRNRAKEIAARFKKEW